MENETLQPDNLSKKIIVNLDSHKTLTIKSKEEKSKRVVTKTRQWTFLPIELSFENQFRIICEIHNNNITNLHSKFVLQQIHKKIYSYKSQDIEKKILSIDEFVNITDVIQKLVDCSMNCYYCRESVSILYEFVREPKQWTLERIDNKRGHNTNNVEIACLSCNLRRRCMYHERYIFTKQLNIKKMS